MNASMIDHRQAIEKLMAERYLLDELGPQERDAFEAHLFECVECFEQVRAGTEFVRYVKRIGAEAPAVPVAGSRWQAFWSHAFRPAPVFALLFFAFSGFSLYQATVIHRFKEPRAMAAPMLKAARGAENPNVVTATRNSLFPLHLLFDARPDYFSYEGQIFRDRTSGGASDAGATPEEGNPVLKSFPISKKDAQDAVAVNLYSGDLQEGDYRLQVLGVRPDGTRASIATYYFKLEFQK
jgi:putative zinc finger protein